MSFAPALTSCGGDAETDAGPGTTDAGPGERDGGPTDGGRTDTGVDASLPECEGPPGLYQDDYCQVLAVGVRRYVPRFALWTDGAEKDRFIYLPDGGEINTSDPDEWSFPIGTRLYKTFSLGGVRLETRLLEKNSDGNWTTHAYAWNEEQTAVIDIIDPTDPRPDLSQNVLGTQHDIPDRGMCLRCHQRAGSMINGFSAIQLNHPDAGLTLEMLNGAGGEPQRLSPQVALTDAVVPGTATDVAALGVLHANCGHCHRETGSAAFTGLHLWVNVALATVQETDTYETAVNDVSNFTLLVGGDTANCRIAGASPDYSVMLLRMHAVGTNISAQMPPIGTEMRYTEGENALSAWIATLPPPSGPGGNTCMTP